MRSWALVPLALVSIFPLRADPVVIARTASTGTLAQAWIHAYHARHPAAELSQTTETTDLPAVSLAELVAGRVTIAPFVRDVQPQELQALKDHFQADPIVVAIATGSFATPSNTHAIALYVNEANPLREISLPQLDAIYSSTRNRGYPEPIRRWSQLGVSGPLSAQAIHPYGMVIERKTGNPHAGIVAYLMEHLLLNGRFDPSTLQVPDTGMGRGNNHALDEIAQAVAGDPAAIGYSGFANQIPGIRALALSETTGGPAIAGTEATVAARTYPLTRTIFALLSPKASQDDLAFMRFVLSPEGQALVKEDAAKFLPLGEDFAASQRARLPAGARP